MLQRSEQLAPGTDCGPSLRPEVLLEFVRALVQNTWSGDVLSLSLGAAQDRTGATEEEMRLLLAAVMTTRNRFKDGFAGEVGYDPKRKGGKR